MKVWIDAHGSKAAYESRVARTAYEFDPADRTLSVEVDLPNEDGRLRPGQQRAAGRVPPDA